MVANSLDRNASESGGGRKGGARVRRINYTSRRNWNGHWMCFVSEKAFCLAWHGIGIYPLPSFS